jgi:hypothetical protein
VIGARSNRVSAQADIGHPDAALYIQVPTLATTVASQPTVKALCRNAIQGEAGVRQPPGCLQEWSCLPTGELPYETAGGPIGVLKSAGAQQGRGPPHWNP